MLFLPQVFCPVSLMDHVKDRVISLAGYVFIKFGFNAEWQKSWILLEKRTLYYTDKVNLPHIFSVRTKNALHE